MAGVAVKVDIDMGPVVGADLNGDLRAGAHLRASDLLHAGQRGDIFADGVDGHGLILSAGGSGGGQLGLGTGDTSGLVGVLNQSDAVTIARVAKSRLFGARWPATYPPRLQRLLTMRPGEFFTTINEI